MTIHEHHIEVRRLARYYVLGDVATAPEMWVACHGYGQLGSRFARHLSGVAGEGRAVVVPEALNRFYLDDPRRPPGPHGRDSRVGATWMTREDREAEIEDYVEYLDALVAHLAAEREAGVPPPRLTVLGFSQGTATVCRWLALGNTRASRVILWAGRVPPEMHPMPKDSPLRALPVLLVSGDEDPLVTTAAIHEECVMLQAAGVRVEHRTYPGSHRLHAETLERIASEA